MNWKACEGEPAAGVAVAGAPGPLSVSSSWLAVLVNVKYVYVSKVHVKQPGGTFVLHAATISGPELLLHAGAIKHKL